MAALSSKNQVDKLELLNLSVELVLVFVVGEHFVAVGECTAQRITEGRFSLDLLIDFWNDILEEELVAGHGDMVLVEVHVIATFDHLEQVRLAGIFRRQVACNRHIALLDVVLLHANDEAVNGGNVVNRVTMVGEFGFGGNDARATGEECYSDDEGCPNDGMFHVLILLFDISFLTTSIPCSKVT